MLKWLIGYVYAIYNVRTNETVYVGSTSNHPLFRWAKHVLCAIQNPKRHKRVHRYMLAKGVHNFNYRILETTFWRVNEDLRKREQYWIDQLSPTCNEYRAFAPAHWENRRVVCECGAVMSRKSITKHRRSAKHAQRLKGRQSRAPSQSGP